MITPTTYPFFESGQVLTNVHLNDLRRFLDEHNRLTRIRLSGTGIVCGFGYSYDSVNKKITIEAGYGISTSGYLIELQSDVTYEYFQPYIDPSTDNYLYGAGTYDEQPDDDDMTFRSDDEDEDTTTQPKAFELLATGTASQTLKDNWTHPTGINNMVLVLYLELLDEDLKSCTGSNCDNKGMKRTVTVRPLLIDKATLTDESTLTPDLIPQLNIKKLTDFTPIVDSSVLEDTYTVLNEEQRGVLGDALADLSATGYPALLDITAGRMTTLAANITAMGTGETYYQYVYDALKDLTFAWNEFVDHVNDLATENGTCFPTVKYPRHLALGVVGNPVTGLSDAYRNIFRPSPALNQSDERFHIARMLFAKMEELATSFLVPGTDTPADITPDQAQLAPHSGRSIPYFYTISGSDPLLSYWAPEQTMRRRKKERFGYFAERYTAQDSFVHPMLYAQDGHPLLRIEGIKGKNIDDALLEIEQLKKDYNLSFPVKVLYFEDGTGEKVVSQDDAFNFIYEDLQEDYYILRDKPVSLLTSVISYLKALIPYITDVTKSSDTDTSDGAKEVLDALNAIIDVLNKMLDELKCILPICLPEFAANFDSFKERYRALIRVLLKTLMDSGVLDGIVSGVNPLDEYGFHMMTAIDEGVSFVTYLGGLLLDRFWFMKFYRIYVRYMTRKHRARSLAEPFQDFAAKNTGMEHLAGTYTYGTFILVCKPDIKA